MGKISDAINQAFGLGRSETTNPDFTGTGWWSKEPKGKKVVDKETKKAHYEREAGKQEGDGEPEQRDGKLW